MKQIKIRKLIKIIFSSRLWLVERVTKELYWLIQSGFDINFNFRLLTASFAVFSIDFCSLLKNIRHYKGWKIHKLISNFLLFSYLLSFFNKKIVSINFVLVIIEKSNMKRIAFHIIKTTHIDLLAHPAVKHFIGKNMHETFHRKKIFSSFCRSFSNLCCFNIKKVEFDFFIFEVI